MFFRFITFFCKTILIITCIGLLKSSVMYLKYCHDHNFSVRGNLAYNANIISHRLADIIFPDYLQSEPNMIIADEGETLFSAACFIGNLDRVKSMLQYNPSINIEKDGGAALYCPVSKEMLTLLFQNGLSADCFIDGEKRSLVNNAIVSGRYEATHCLVHDLHQRPAIAYKDLLQLYVLGFFDKYNKNIRKLFGDKDPTQLLEYLIELGADIGQRDPDNQFTYLHYAVQMNDIYFAEVLLDHGIDWLAKDSSGYTALDYAYHFKNKKMIDLLRNPMIKNERHRAMLNKLVV